LSFRGEISRSPSRDALLSLPRYLAPFFFLSHFLVVQLLPSPLPAGLNFTSRPPTFFSGCPQCRFTAGKSDVDGAVSHPFPVLRCTLFGNVPSGGFRMYGNFMLLLRRLSFFLFAWARNSRAGEMDLMSPGVSISRED